MALAIAYGGTGTYASIMRGAAPATFHNVVQGDDRRPREVPVDLAGLVGYHTSWFSYVTGETPEPPVSLGAAVFTRDEYAHMADVRHVFIAFRIAAVAAALVGVGLLLRVTRRRRRSAVVLSRDASVVAALSVAAFAAVAVVAFDPLFLLFHEAFFPQGNFLFPPDSNLLVVYPDEYWYGVTLRIGFTFAAAMALIGLGAAATLRQHRR